MKLLDYTGKLNQHNTYLQIIKQLGNRCKYIEYVLVNEEETKISGGEPNLVKKIRYIK